MKSLSGKAGVQLRFYKTPEYGESSSPKIIHSKPDNGENAVKDTDFMNSSKDMVPYTISIDDDNDIHGCGGVIINHPDENSNTNLTSF